MAGELRITGGTLVRRRIAVPPAADRGSVRPTSDKVRAALMSSLGSALENARVLDLFAGSGALGIEALSRGAQHAVFVEKDEKTARVVTANLASLSLAARSRVVVSDAPRALRGLPAASFDVILVDPPYTFDVTRLYDDLLRVRAPGGVIVLERDKRSLDAPLATVVLLRERLYGDTRVVVYGEPEAANAPSLEEPMPTAAIYPGSFDPLTNGHIDIVERGLKTFDRVIVAVANNVQKTPLFSVEDRMRHARECLGHLKGIEVDTFDGLVVEYAKHKGVRVLLRGLRAVSDFEYEFQLASMNRKLNRDIDTVFMMTSEESFYLSSRLVREVASLGGNIEGMVPDPVLAALRSKYIAAKKGK
jgi:pantetheine-phosphate adenylyltransferase